MENFYDSLTMDPGVFDGLDNLQSLLLVKTGLEGPIPQGLLKGLTNVTYLEINEPYVEELPGKNEKQSWISYTYTIIFTTFK